MAQQGRSWPQAAPPPTQALCFAPDLRGAIMGITGLLPSRPRIIGALAVLAPGLIRTWRWHDQGYGRLPAAAPSQNLAHELFLIRIPAPASPVFSACQRQDSRAGSASSAISPAIRQRSLPDQGLRPRDDLGCASAVVHDAPVLDVNAIDNPSTSCR
jgi:hypothetical protein